MVGKGCWLVIFLFKCSTMFIISFLERGACEPSVFSIWSVITPLVYIWVNIDTRWHTKSLKSQNIAVGPQDPPPRDYQDPIPQVTKG